LTRRASERFVDAVARSPAGFRKSLVLFNLHRAIATKTNTVIVVEGFFDAIAVHQAGYPVVGLMGSTLSRHQADLLARHFRRVLLMLDGDPAGQQAAAAINRSLTERVPVTVITLPDGTQPDHLTSPAIQHLVSRFTPDPVCATLAVSE
jgi:DNA primase